MWRLMKSLTAILTVQAPDPRLSSFLPGSRTGQIIFAPCEVEIKVVLSSHYFTALE